MHQPGGPSDLVLNEDFRPNIHSHLASSERLLSSFGSFHATNYRVLRLDPPEGPTKGRLLEIPYHRLISVDLVRRANHPLLVLGTVMVLLGLFIMPVLPVSALLTLPIAGGVLFMGARGKPGYFQLYTHDMPKREEGLWRVEYERSGNFVATLRSAIGQMPEF